MKNFKKIYIFYYFFYFIICFIFIILLLYVLFLMFLVDGPRVPETKPSPDVDLSSPTTVWVYYVGGDFLCTLQRAAGIAVEADVVVAFLTPLHYRAALFPRVPGVPSIRRGQPLHRPHSQPTEPVHLRTVHLPCPPRSGASLPLSGICLFLKAKIFKTFKGISGI